MVHQVPDFMRPGFTSKIVAEDDPACFFGIRNFGYTVGHCYWEAFTLLVHPQLIIVTIVVSTVFSHMGR